MIMIFCFFIVFCVHIIRDEQREDGRILIFDLVRNSVRSHIFNLLSL